MIELLFRGEVLLFVLLVAALITSLSFHEFGHAYVAKLNGDPTAQLAGRLTLNPVRHIDPMGLVMVVLVGFGYAKPVPTNPRNFRSKRADLWIAAAGPATNLLLAVITWNLFLLLRAAGVGAFFAPGPVTFFALLVRVNLLLMLFNLIPPRPAGWPLHPAPPAAGAGRAGVPPLQRPLRLLCAARVDCHRHPRRARVHPSHVRRGRAAAPDHLHLTDRF